VKHLCSYLSQGAENHPDEPLFRFLDRRGNTTGQHTYGEFEQRTNAAASYLASQHGIGQGRTVILSYRPGLEIAVAFYACLKLGAIPVPVPPPNLTSSGADLQTIDHIINDTGARLILTDEPSLTHLVANAERNRGIQAWLESLSPRHIQWDSIDSIREIAGPFDRTENSHLFIQYTSGSTRKPRGVMVQNANVMHNCNIGFQHERPIGVSWLPHYHDMGLIGYFIFSVLRGGSAICFSPLTFLRNPLLWFQAISKYEATVTTAPNFAFQYCLDEKRIPPASLEPLNLSSLKTIVNASEPVRARTYADFFSRFSACGLREAAYTTGYGLAEHTLAVTSGGRRVISASIAKSGEVTVCSGKTRPKPANSVELVSSGRPGFDVDVKIVDPENMAVLGEDVEGEIWVNSPSKAAGYFGNRELTGLVFNARPARQPAMTSYLKTGDMGFLHRGELYVCGRLKDMIIVRGNNIYPSDIEWFVADQYADIEPKNVVAFGVPGHDNIDECVTIAFESRTNYSGNDLREIARRVSEKFKFSVSCIALVARGNIQRTSSGKIARQRFRELWQSGKIQVTQSLELEPKPGLTAGLLSERLSSLPNSALLPLGSAGLDSVDLVNISLHLDELLEKSSLSNTIYEKYLSDINVLQALTIAQYIQLTDELGRDKPNEKLCLGIFNHASGLMNKAVQEQMRGDTGLAIDHHDDQLKPADGPTDGPTDGNVSFLTGATGFLGSFLLKSLLELTRDHICLLVRCDDRMHGERRVRTALGQTGMSSAAIEKSMRRRITIFNGSLSRENFGLSDADWTLLVNEVSNIYHCGAQVDYLKTYEMLRGTNVLATGTVAKIAGEGKSKTIHFISTTFIFGWTAFSKLMERHHNRWMKGLNFGYSQSKWVAEEMLRKAVRNKRTLKIYRPSLVTASMQGAFRRHDITARILGYMIRHGIAPDLGNQISFVPVDIAARNIIAISRHSDPHSGNLHITADEIYTIKDVCQVISEIFGYSFRTVGIDDFVEHMNIHCLEDDELYPLRTFIIQNHKSLKVMENKTYDSTNYRKARLLSADTLAHPGLVETVSPIVDYLISENLIPGGAKIPNKNAPQTEMVDTALSQKNGLTQAWWLPNPAE
jgi:thioester reductase-like protein